MSADQFIAEVDRLIPQFLVDFEIIVDGGMTTDQISEAAFRKSEYLGGMAEVIVALIESKE